MGVAPDFGAKIDGWEDGCGVYPNVVEDVGTEGSDKRKGMGIEIWDAGDVSEEISFNEFLLGDPKFLSAVVDNGVLMGVTVDCKGTSGGAEEVGEDVC